MDAERWKRVEDLLQSALELPDAQHEEFLRQECAGDAELLQEVRSLLAAHREAGNFLDPPEINDSNALTQTSLVGASPPAMPSITGQIVSHYRVLGQLGSGGMGVVYQAEDIKLGRRVAMKFLPGEVASDRVAFERMQREARAASALDHPNICSIYELGEDEGHPFIVMQLLEGQTLREWILRSAKQEPQLRLEQTLDLAIQMANGLEAAHQKGIAHRDIKPANVFVTARGEAKILDFGLAKVLEDHLAPEVFAEATVTDAAAIAADPARLHLTRTGTTMGTAYYMSPEQVRGGKLDARTDLFSLGLVIYEMVTGQRAFAGETGPAVHDAILHRDPAAVRQLNPAVPAELERIINKALEKDRTRRYRSAQEMASDLQNLREEMRPAVLWRGRKWKVITAGAVFVVLAVSLGVLIERSWQPVPRETVPAVKSRRSVAVLGFRNLSNNSGEEWISTALEEMVSTELAAGQQLRMIPGESVAHMKLDLALPVAGGYGRDTLKKIRKNLGTDVIVQGSYLVSPGSSLRIDLQVQEAEAGDTIATASESGSDAQIAELVSRAGASLRQQLGIAAIPADMDKARTALPADPRAARLYSEGLAKLDVFDALAARDLLTKAIALAPDHAMSHSLLAESLSALGYEANAQAEAKKAFDLSHSLPRDSQLLVEGRYRELSNDYPAAIEAYRTLWKFFPDDLDYGLKLAEAQDKADLHKDALLTIAQLRRLPEPSGNDPRIDVAEADASESLGDFKHTQEVASAGAEKARLQGSRLLEAQAKTMEGRAWDRLGDVDKATAAYSEAHDLAQAGGNLRAASRALNGMANVLYDKGDMDGAGKLYQEALRLARQLGAQKSIASFTSNLGNVYYEQGKLAEAQRQYKEGLEIDRLIGNKHGFASDLGNLANVVQGMGDLSRATRMQEETLEAFREVGDRRGEGDTLNNLGSVLEAHGELLAAQKRFEEAIAMAQQLGYQRGRERSMVSMAGVLLAQGKVAEARAATLGGLTILKEMKDEFGIAEGQVQLGEIAVEEGNAAEAEGLARGAAEEFDRQKAADNGCSANAILGRALLAQGKLKEAQTATDLAVVLCQRGQDRESRFQATMASAAVKFKAGGAAEALHMLEKVNSEAARSGYVPDEMASRLLMGEIEINSGKKASGRARLEGLQKDAQSKSFGLIARKAQTGLNGGSFEF